MELWDHVKWGRFKDGWPNIFIDDVHSIAGRDGKLADKASERHSNICQYSSVIYSFIVMTIDIIF